jgi:membrane-associated phospholipid phosphatase
MHNVQSIRFKPAVSLLAGYTGIALLLVLWRSARGDFSWIAVGGYALLLAAIVLTARAERGWRLFVRDWLPLLALPVLYALIPATAVTSVMFDAGIQAADRAVFGTDVARTLAGAVPSRAVSEILHGAYLSYYVIIYLPPVLMYASRDERAFDRTVLSFTGAMVVCFLVFCVFPVEGPRYAWPPPPGVPEGPVRSSVLAILSGGSSRGTAFPSSHQAIALVMTLSSMQWNRRLGWPLLVATTLLGVGAVYGGFHYGVDMLAGAAVGGLCWWLGLRGGAVISGRG